MLECTKAMSVKQRSQGGSLKPGKVKITRAREGPAISREEFFALKKPKGDLILEVDGERVSITSLDRVYWPDEKLTKFDLLCYFLRIDRLIMPYLDPKAAPWKNVLDVALVCKEVIDELGLPAFPKTSGSSGIHIYLPLKPKHDYRKVAAVAEALAAEVAQRAPKIATVQRSLAKRQKQQVYVDAMQNARGKTIAAAYSARAKPGATVSMPLSWKQIEKGVKIADFTIKNVPVLVEKNGDAWKDFFDKRQTLK